MHLQSRLHYRIKWRAPGLTASIPTDESILSLPNSHMLRGNIIYLAMQYWSHGVKWFIKTSPEKRSSSCGKIRTEFLSFALVKGIKQRICWITNGSTCITIPRSSLANGSRFEDVDMVLSFPTDSASSLFFTVFCVSLKFFSTTSWKT